MATKRAWHIVTGEYPPDHGGVSDYTQLVARGLAAAGDDVHVWAPGREGTPSNDEGVHVHRLRNRFDPKGVAELAKGLDAHEGSKRILLQYVPNAFGWKAMNVPFTAWIATRRDEKLWVMFHEVATPWDSGANRRARDLVLGAVTRAEAIAIATRADRAFVSVPAWDRLLRGFVPTFRGAEWSPIPSNTPVDADSDLVASVLATKKKDGPRAKWIGHFGTYGGPLAKMLAPILVRLLEKDRTRFAVLLGRRGDAFAKSLPSHVTDQVHALGEKTPAEIAATLACCDVVLQPYPDGISSRRTSAMASVALGRAVVSHAGAQTEAVWGERHAVVLARDESTDAFVHATEPLLHDEALAAAVGERARALYRDRFSIERTVERLRADARAEDGA